MAQISASDVSKLRTMTGAGMMDCKKALEEAAGDFEKAVEIIRKKGQLIANKRADREATEGAVLSATSADGKFGAIIALACETDFVAKNADFVKLAENILDVATKNRPENLDALKKLQLGGKVIGDLIVEQMGVIGEKIDVVFYAKIEAEQVVPYIHPGNKLATAVGFNKALSNIQIGKDVAMQVAAMSPVAVDKDDVPQSVIDKEIEIGKDQARNEGKPENMVEKIALGKLNKFYKESTLLNQEFIKDGKLTVSQYVKSSDKDLTVKNFIRYTVKN
jgi:elongation factor Ts